MNTQVNNEVLRRQLRDIYDCYRTALYNRQYYGCKLDQYRRWNRVLDIFLAIGSSTVVGGWLIWKNDIGATIWGIITAIVAVVAIAKPILDLPKAIERYSKLFVGHGDIYYDLRYLMSEVEQQQAFSDKMKESYQRTLNRRNTLAADDDANQNAKLAKKCFESVNKQIPPETLWMPPTQTN